MEIILKQEAVERHLIHYNTGKPCAHGHVGNRLVSTGKCVECARLYHTKYIKQWQQDNKHKVNKATRTWRLNNPDKAAETHKTYYNKVKVQKLQYNKLWRQDNPALVQHYNVTRRATILQAKVSWIDENVVQQIYDESVTLTSSTGIQHHVDHIIPLVHNLVCGLHWEGNLQVLTATENQSKGNKLSIG